MASTSTTRIVRNTKVAWSGMSSVLVRLMMVVNDMGIINESLRHWNTSTDEERRGRKGGGRAFFVRVQMAYVFEGLGVIKDIRAATKGSFELNPSSKCDKPRKRHRWRRNISCCGCSIRLACYNCVGMRSTSLWRCRPS
jgi:hypothetical protein